MGKEYGTWGLSDRFKSGPPKVHFEDGRRGGASKVVCQEHCPRPVGVKVRLSTVMLVVYLFILGKYINAQPEMTCDFVVYWYYRNTPTPKTPWRSAYNKLQDKN